MVGVERSTSDKRIMNRRGQQKLVIHQTSFENLFGMNSNCAPAEASSYIERCGYKTSMHQTLSQNELVACYVPFSAIWIGDSETKPKQHKEIYLQILETGSHAH